MSTLKIGVVGFSAQQFERSKAIRLLEEVFDEAVADHPDAVEIWVISGLADVGVPGLAYRIAVDRGWMTFAVDCLRSAKYKPFPVDGKEIIDSMVRGSESQAFLAQCDVIVRIGGGEQSLAEVQMFKDQGGIVYERELEALVG